MDRKRQRIYNFIITIVVLIVCGAVIAISFAIKIRVENKVASSAETTPITSDNSIIDELIDEPQDAKLSPNEVFIDLQPTLDTWLNTVVQTPSNVGVMIYDLNHNEIAASHNADTVFSVASIYKLLFVYDGYRQITMGKEKADELFVSTADKGDLTLSQCLDLMIRESYNGCADPMASNKTRVARVGNLMRETEMDNTSGIGLESTASDLTKLLRKYWRHADLTNQLWNQLTDSMLIQPIFINAEGTSTNLRQGLPAGFSNLVNVYNKVGWEWNPEKNRWNIYADAAIVSFIDYQHYYTVVVLTKNINSANIIAQLGEMIETAVISQTEEAIK